MYIIFNKDGSLHMACSTLPQNIAADENFLIGELEEAFDHRYEYTYADGKAIKGALIPEDLEEIARINAELEATAYQVKRKQAYPSIEDQLDTLYHGGYDAWKASIDEVKERFPKPE